MGEQADFLTDAMLEARAAHEAGHCEYRCEWCEEPESEEPPDRKKPILTPITIKVNRRTLNALAALRKILKHGDGQIVARAVADLASRHLPQKAKRKR